MLNRVKRDSVHPYPSAIAQARAEVKRIEGEMGK